MEVKKERLLFVDMLKLLAIYLVLWGHCVQQFLTSPALENDVYVYIYSFHMPLFMMLSGYFSSSSMSVPFLPFLKKKGVQLLLPVFSWSVLAFFLYMLLDMFVTHDGAGLLYGRNIVRAFGNFWFLKSLFICYLVAWCGRNSKLPSWVWILTTLLLSQLISKYNVKIMYPCFLAGMALKNCSGFVRKYRAYIFTFSTLLSAFLLLYWDGGFLKPANLMQAVSENDIPAIAGELYVRLYRILTGLSVSLSLYMLFMFLFENVEGLLLKRLASIGRYTLNIYLLQVLSLEILLGEFLSLDAVSLPVANYLLTPLLSLALLLFCVMMSRLAGRSERLGFILFGQRR